MSWSSLEAPLLNTKASINAYLILFFFPFSVSVPASVKVRPDLLRVTQSLTHFLSLLSVPVCNDEEDSGFTGKRFNSKMMVYSGSKTAYLPKMMTLYEQCIRVLQNNIDCEWSGGMETFNGWHKYNITQLNHKQS